MENMILVIIGNCSGLRNNSETSKQKETNE